MIDGLGKAMVISMAGAGIKIENEIETQELLTSIEGVETI